MAPVLRALLALAIFLVQCSQASPTPVTYAVKEALPHVPRGWALHGPAPASHTLTLRIGLKQPGFPDLHNALYEVSDPSHPRYGQHLSKEEVETLIAPHPTSVELVDGWLQEHGIGSDSISRSPAGDFVTFTIPVKDAEKLLNTKYSVFRHVKSGEAIVRTTSWSLPDYLHSHVDVVQPTTMFGRMRDLKTSTRFRPLTEDVVPDATSCRTVTPACLESLYSTTGYTPSATASTLGITGYLEQYANAADLQSFYKKYATSAVKSTFTTVLINGGENPQSASEAGTEANLDTQYAGALSYPIPNIFYSTGGSPPFTPDDLETTNSNEPYADWLTHVLAETTLPTTITTSYGDDEQTVPLSYATSVCNQFAQLGARGVSLMFASGDSGVGDGNGPGETSECYSNNGENTAEFIPNFPASCPYVTTVGATTSTGPEVAASFSGGGFSNYFAQPSYQATSVNSYVAKLGTTYQGLYNATGRAYPDVSAQGENFVIYVGGESGTVDGTSCASPTFAGVISLVNDALIQAGKSPLGFLNPFLYGAGVTGLTDIMSGDNPGCGTDGFSAGTGWDPVTGLGTPDFAKLRTLAGA